MAGGGRFSERVQRPDLTGGCSALSVGPPADRDMNSSLANSLGPVAVVTFLLLCAETRMPHRGSSGFKLAGFEPSTTPQGRWGFRAWARVASRARDRLLGPSAHPTPLISRASTGPAVAVADPGARSALGSNSSRALLRAERCAPEFVNPKHALKLARRGIRAFAVQCGSRAAEEPWAARNSYKTEKGPGNCHMSLRTKTLFFQLSPGYLLSPGVLTVPYMVTTVHCVARYGLLPRRTRPYWQDLEGQAPV
ncbi:hypothetical protein FIBSPDRAFT_926858 [Athelia psychrophila]|uniref:Uncharacterized protein n=1 Tax=Athelia psychrophila TaxID=1759441 RepID=A0A166SPG2_9AGAM|nr:hypothetical protein FIBSPDRAFT_926858 [Fibularhizoctonia sp. CBS 109695]